MWAIVKIAQVTIVANKRRTNIHIFPSFKKLLRDLVKISPLFLAFILKHLMYVIIRSLIPTSLYPKFLYSIEDEFVSTTTRVICTSRKHNEKQICLKLCQLDNEKVCNDKLVTRRLDYLLEGFKFNQRFAPRVYLGIAAVEQHENQYKILRHKLIIWPNKRKMKSRMEYALIMRRLDESNRLDRQIYQQQLSEPVDFEFLAKEVARMHLQLDISPEDKGKPTSIASKLEINRQLFEECLLKLNESSDFLKKYRWISELMALANARCTDLFQQRYDDQCIKRCHGDLKTTNLWIEPAKSHLLGLIKQPRRLLALDCIDFNPEFCHIDTLSDLAMLVIDLEMYLLTDWLKVNHDSNKQEGERLTRYFLDCYLREMQEDRNKCDTLLEYYMTEKSMVCAYVSILYDERPLIGKKYLEVAYIHAQRLEKMLKQSTSKKQTPSLVVTS